jgi:hypothetical protein
MAAALEYGSSLADVVARLGRYLLANTRSQLPEELF